MHDRRSTMIRRRLVWRVLTFAAVLACLAVGLSAADPAWTWVGPAGPDTVSLLLMGDVDIQLRADPATAFTHLAATLKRADVVYCNLEGMLVAPKGKGIDIPDKGGWQHPGPEAAQALKADNIAVVGVANNTAYGRANIMKTLALLDASGIKHTGAGANLEAAHEPAIVEAHGVKIGFLQYTARWYFRSIHWRRPPKRASRRSRRATASRSTRPTWRGCGRTFAGSGRGSMSSSSRTTIGMAPRTSSSDRAGRARPRRCVAIRRSPRRISANSITPCWTPVRT